MPPPGGNCGVEMGGSSLDEPLTEFEVRKKQNRDDKKKQIKVISQAISPLKSKTRGLL